MLRFPAFALLVACLVPPALAQEPGRGSTELVQSLEARLLSARQVRIEARIVATGVVSAALAGETVLRQMNQGSFRYSGTFNDQRIDVHYEADGPRFEISNNGQSRKGKVAVATNRALVLGMTRMGLLHNIVRATSLDAPDHAFGGVENWITLDGFLPTTFAQVGELAGLPSLGFELLVNLEPSARVRLWLAPDSGLPRRREQTVEFPTGEMRVVETYTLFEVE